MTAHIFLRYIEQCGWCFGGFKLVLEYVISYLMYVVIYLFNFFVIFLYLFISLFIYFTREPTLDVVAFAISSLERNELFHRCFLDIKIFSF